jgi:hypothetical protein
MSCMLTRSTHNKNKHDKCGICSKNGPYVFYANSWTWVSWNRKMCNVVWTDCCFNIVQGDADDITNQSSRLGNFWPAVEIYWKVKFSFDMQPRREITSGPDCSLYMVPVNEIETWLRNPPTSGWIGLVINCITEVSITFISWSFIVT